MLMLKSWQDRYLVIVSVTFESKWQIFYGGDLGSFLEVTDGGDSVVTGSVVIAVVIRVSTVVVSVVVSVVNLGFSLSLGLPLEQPVDVIVGGGVGSGGHGGGVGHGSVGVGTVDGGVSVVIDNGVVVENLSVSLGLGLSLSLPLVDGVVGTIHVGGGVGGGHGGGVSGGGHGGGVGHGSVVVGASVGVSTVDGGVVVVENLSVSLRLGLSLPLVDGVVGAIHVGGGVGHGGDRVGDGVSVSDGSHDLRSGIADNLGGDLDLLDHGGLVGDGGDGLVQGAGVDEGGLVAVDGGGGVGTGMKGLLHLDGVGIVGGDGAVSVLHEPISVMNGLSDHEGEERCQDNELHGWLSVAA